MNFGFTQEDRVSASVALRPDPQAPFKAVKIKSAKMENITTKNNDVKPVLNVTFVGNNGAEYTHTEWCVDFGSRNEEKNYGFQKSRIGHIYAAMGGDPLADFSVTIETPPTDVESQRAIFTRLYTLIAQKMTEKIADLEAKKNNNFYLLLVYTTSGDVSLPIVPNFIEAAMQGVGPRTLQVDKRYHVLVQPDVNKPASSIPNAPGAPMGGAEGFDIP